VVEPVDVFDAGNGRDSRAAPGCDQDPFACQLALSDAYVCASTKFAAPGMTP
jgi:hypothetical protein